MSWSCQLFGYRPEELPIAGQAKEAWQRQQFDATGRSSADLRIGPDVVATANVVDSLRAAAAANGRPVRAAVPIGDVHHEFGRNCLGSVHQVDETLHYDLVVGGQHKPGSAGFEAEPSLVDLSLQVVGSAPQPGRMAQPISTFGGGGFIWSINHWFDLLVANLLAVQTTCARMGENRIAAGASVHPTAVVENSVVDDGAVIGPLAVVRNAHIGPRVIVEDQANVRSSIVGAESTLQTQCVVSGSAIGPQSVISFHAAIRGSLLFGRSTISAPVVARSVIGPETFLARGVAISASTLADTPIRVRVGSQTVSTGARLVGCAVGAGSRIGNGVTIPGGYTVPAGIQLAERPLPKLSPETPTGTSLLLDGSRIRTLPTLKGMTT